MRIATVIVTYNRNKLLKKCIKAIQNQTVQINSIYVINNGSTDGTSDWLDKQKGLIVINQENCGGSGGFYRGIKEAYEKGFDWIWCMDDDVYPDKICLENMLKFDSDNTGIICPIRIQNGKITISEIKKFNLTNPLRSLHYNKIKEIDIIDNKFNYIEGIAFEGPLIKKEIVAKIGLPNKDLFILYDDSEYGYKSILAGYKIKLVSSAIFYKEFFLSKLTIKELIKANKWKTNYHVRNTAYFNKKYGKNVLVKKIRPFACMLKYELYICKNIIFNNKYCIKDFINIYKSYKRGINNTLGKMDF
jgi:GT2 family glycosyltransferase